MGKSRKSNAEIDTYNLPFPKLLRELMEKENVKQDVLAKYTNLSRQAISQYKDGNTFPDINTFIDIVDYFKQEKRN